MLKNQKGFSLVELMIVVAIIGILAAIAIPNFQKFQEKARQTEAQSSLSGIYTAEEAFYAEYNSFSGELDQVGFAPSGSVGYNAGFPAVGVSLANPPGTAACFQTCSAVATTACPASTGIVCNNLNGVYGGAVPGVAPTATAFTAGAAALLNPSIATKDQWTMTNAQVLANISNGL